MAAGVSLMPRFQWEGRITPQFLVSMMNFLAIAFTGGMIWSATTGDISTNRKQLERLESVTVRSIERVDRELERLRAQDTAIAVLKNDVGYIKEGMDRIERKLAPK
jgi:hypothetical protein